MNDKTQITEIKRKQTHILDGTMELIFIYIESKNSYINLILYS